MKSLLCPLHFKLISASGLGQSCSHSLGCLLLLSLAYLLLIFLSFQALPPVRRLFVCFSLFFPLQLQLILSLTVYEDLFLGHMSLTHYSSVVSISDLVFSAEMSYLESKDHGLLVFLFQPLTQILGRQNFVEPMRERTLGRCEVPRKELLIDDGAIVGNVNLVMIGNTM